MSSAAWHLELDTAVIDDLAFDDDVEETLDEVSDIVVDKAAQLAPKASGAGAASIHGEPGRDGESVYVDVSWDAEHFYMGFAELGTGHQSARPFLRPALDQTSI